MSDLKFQEIKKIHAFLGSRGYFMSHRELDTIFKQHQLDKYDDLDPNLIAYEVGSKRDRLDAFFTNWPNLAVSAFLLEFLDEVIKKEELNDAEIAELEQCKQIALNLRHRTNDQGNPTLPSPYFENIRENILADLDKAKQVIWICMYLFTDYKIARKVLEKYREGLSVEIILQDDEINRREELQSRYWNKIPSILWWYPKTDGGILHHKFCIIDGRVIWDGSFNFTHTAATKNKESYFTDKNVETVHKYADQFKKIKKYIAEEQRLRNDLF
tara:strand:- start:243 stop:1055 length:813 start_codon:yes stop_codon:yes gene_type:complete